jgi:nitroreductase
MNVMDAIKTRQSIRKYKNIEVTNEHIIALMEAARLAPSGSNTQPWRFILIREKVPQKAIAEVCQQEWMLSAPLFIVCVADTKVRIKEPNVSVSEESPQLDLKRVIRDTTIAIEHVVLQAQAMGLSSCWVGYFTQAELRPVLAVPPDKYIVAVLTIGFSAESPERKPRKALDDLVYYNRWGSLS